MAYNKEAIAIVLDVGSTMNQAPPGEESFLETSIAAIRMILQRKLFAESKDEVALILFGTNDTANDLADGESYEHISLARPLGMVNWQLMQYLENDVHPTDQSADFLDAMVVAFDHLLKSLQGKRGFASKRLILFSDVGGSFTDDQLGDILGSFKEQEVELNVIGPDLDDDDDDEEGDGDARPSGSNSKPKTSQQKKGEALLKRIITEVNGASYSFAEALPALSFFQTRQVRPTPWKCNLDIGPDLQIPIAGYIKIKEAKAKTFKNVYAKDPDSAIKRQPSYHLNDDEETEIDVSDTVDGHRYGSTLVPVGEEDKNAMKLPKGKCFKVLGFTDAENVKRHNFLGDSTMVIFGDKGDEAAGIALSAFVQALYETNTVAIVRRCYSAASNPKLGCLVPHIKAKYECLFYNELPFAEDLRLFTFGSLPLSENAPAAMKKFQPTDAQLNAVDELINTMDLTNVNQDEDDDDKEEALKPKHTFNPHLQRLYQCLQHRALHPDDPLPELTQTIADSLKPPQEVVTCSEPVVEKLTKMFKLEEVAKKKDGENVFADVAADNGPAAKKPRVDNDIDGNLADIVKSKVTEVGTVTPVEDFKALVSQKQPQSFTNAFDMMVKRVEQIVMDSFGSQFYPKAMECLTALREESVNNEKPQEFNDFLRAFKGTLHSKGRKDFWKNITNDKVTLISKQECKGSRVTKTEADEFISEKEAKEESKPDTAADDDQDDLLDQLE